MLFASALSVPLQGQGDTSQPSWCGAGEWNQGQFCALFGAEGPEGNRACCCLVGPPGPGTPSASGRCTHAQSEATAHLA